ncbi:isoprenoid synthase domain-containing protein [Staphylotrichum tortipilum]|uniref:Isoprenoid synthase domain-containing protein n=1 Tax=Staphylotrichum tortipilum TaxID=2831512 RepID=A0AAN6RP83_9PEZI|nr:isoprenoid synthase domain-containing protein [Staphylotrichum longicolle]
MLLFRGLREYERSSPWPERSTISIQLQHDLKIKLDVPNFGVTAAADSGVDPKSTPTRVVPAHAAFKAALLPDVVPDEAFYKTCTAEVNVISLFFPDITSEVVRIAFAAWLAFVCVMDDILETVEIGERELLLLDTIEVLKCEPNAQAAPASPKAFGGKDRRVPSQARALFDHCTRYLSHRSARAFFTAACDVLEAHIDEISFLQGRYSNTLPTYMSIRSRTIALAPFFEVIKTEYLADADWALNPIWQKLQKEVACVAGLQNDMIGLVRDLEDGEPLNGVVVLMQGFRSIVKNQLDRGVLSKCLALVNAEHNQSVARCFEHMTQLHRAAEASGCTDVGRIESVARHILMMCETHLRWCSSSKRYRLEVGVNTAQTQQMATSPPQQPPPTQMAVERPAPTQPSQAQTAVSKQLIVQSNGIFHGLPTFPDTPENQNLTALVTGATGLSGYNMVRALAAAPQRWGKIYCLSSRPPPDNFFDDLGEGAQRVEHLPVNFLDDPSEIARLLQEKVQHVDHIFYFSYLQPAPKGDVLNLWAHADELATANVTLFNNFIQALQQTPLTPRRFMLQTGSKHYAFYLGPASIPAFETDPRVHIDRNFYYEQEDILSAYCRSVGAAWNVARPSYIIGAVRDGTLNHLIGFGIYAAVQAHLGQAIAFPGDYRAWDREQVQSTGMLNAYFEEWLVLTGKTANEAFNIHDGLSFTWGRLWPYLAKWYKGQWNPPEEDEAKYRVMKMPCPQTPKGYGPQATLRSIFSLLEWSLQPHVEEAWNTLAKQHGLVLNPFDDRYRARIFSFSDSAVIGDAPMTTSVRKAREFGFLGTVDSYRSIFNTLHDLASLRLIPSPAIVEFNEW